MPVGFAHITSILTTLTVYLRKSIFRLLRHGHRSSYLLWCRHGPPPQTRHILHCSCWWLVLCTFLICHGTYPARKPLLRTSRRMVLGCSRVSDGTSGLSLHVRIFSYSRSRSSSDLILSPSWIFVVQFATVIVYLLIFLHLKNTLTTILPSSHSTTHAKVDRAARLMLMFPLAYIILTLPLSAGRMWSMAHHTYNIHEGYQLASGALIACSGMVDCLLYTLTRRSLVQSNTSSENKSTNGLDSYDLSRLNGITQTRTVTVTGDRVSTLSSTTRVSVDDDDAYSMRTISTTPRKKNHLREPARTHSPTSSIDRLAGVDGLDPRKPTHKVQISTYEARTSEDVDSLRDSERSESPVNVMRGLAKMVKLPNLMDRK
jgi:heme/copper-type cytochrome/quinol oxidase subunit 4